MPHLKIQTLAALLVVAVLALGGCATPRAVPAGATTRPLPAGAPELLTADDDAVAADFNNLYVQDDVYFAGYPTEAGLREMSRRGVRTVVSLKTPEQVMEARGLDESALAGSLGLDLIWLPISPESFSESDVERFAEAYEGSTGPLLIHCGSTNTVGGLWAAYLHRRRGVPLENAIEAGRSIGLRKDSMVDAARRVAAEAPGMRE